MPARRQRGMSQHHRACQWPSRREPGSPAAERPDEPATLPSPAHSLRIPMVMGGRAPWGARRAANGLAQLLGGGRARCCGAGTRGSGGTALRRSASGSGGGEAPAHLCAYGRGPLCITLEPSGRVEARCGGGPRCSARGTRPIYHQRIGLTGGDGGDESHVGDDQKDEHAHHSDGKGNAGVGRKQVRCCGRGTFARHARARGW
mmetsp:Transcript_13477/g.39780  ORF Transcript_13477/g.39780 Transcript_13477/m.39780 type:complete len:203 (-) Transcript_13477:125-733(-)